MAFNQEETIQLMEALLSAYSIKSFERMLYFNLSKDLEEIATGNLRDIIFEVIKASEKEGWQEKLVHAAHDANPDNPKLKAFTSQYLRFKEPSKKLEKIITQTNSYIDPAGWRLKVSRIERQVCSIEIKAEHVGTGFLIAPDLVMTNYHVIEEMLGESPKHDPSQVRIRFDYKKSDDGNELNDGIRYKLLIDEWLVGMSPYSMHDVNGTDQTPELNELDYAVLKLAPKLISGSQTVPGDEAITGSEDKIRGWIQIPNNAYEFKQDTPLFIVQHPSGAPLKIDMNTQSIISVNSNNTRVRYRTNTEPGSSGSPCFNSNWELVALHHSGDSTILHPEWNQGIPIDNILSNLSYEVIPNDEIDYLQG